MKLTAHEEIDAGRRWRVFDADGEEVFPCVQCDSETGEVVTQKLKDGRPYVTGGKLAVEYTQRKAPLRLERIA